MSKHKTPSIVILAAGKGSRLGGSVPKPLTMLPNNESIMGRQLRNIHKVFEKAKVNIVVGYKAEEIQDAFPNENYIYSAEYDITNTSKSLYKALKMLPKNKGVLWFNGDVVFDNDLLWYVQNRIQKDENFLVTDTKKVSDEEVKYSLNPLTNLVTKLSKTVPLTEALGEAVGINYINSATLEAFTRELRLVDNNDYFEKGIENLIQKYEVPFEVFDISEINLQAVEVDFSADLEHAKGVFF